MKLLLDTCTFLWLIWDEAPLTAAMRTVLADPDNAVFLSVVSVWEAVQKHATGNLSLRTRESAWQHFVHQREAHALAPLPFNALAVRHLSALPRIHRDPFDRLLICQAIEESLTIITPDVAIRRYPLKTLWG